REEWPDVDAFFMDAMQAITGAGGWPLNVFATADLKPFFGGTYYPPRPAFNRKSWMEILEIIVDLWHNKYEQIETQTTQMIAHLKNASSVSSNQLLPMMDDEAFLKSTENLLKNADEKYGGFGAAPKFPSTMSIRFLLQQYQFKNDEKALAHALFSIEALLKGGIYDQLGGGLARYATDAQWLVPHFEKMLYDNALFLMALADAYNVTGKKLYLQKMDEIVQFVYRELGNGVGGFYSAIDADSEGEEGKFYVFDWVEIGETIVKKYPLAIEYFGLTPEGNWEGKNILHIRDFIKTFAEKNKLDEAELTTQVEALQKELLTIRSQRIRPQTDDKCVLSWNMMMVVALIKIYAVSGKEDHLLKAKQSLQWAERSFLFEGDWQRVFNDNSSAIPAQLEDYAWLINAYLSISEFDDAENNLLKAVKILEKVLEDFSDEAGVFFRLSSRKTNILPVNKIEVYDGAQPSANSIMMENLMWLSLLFEKNEWWEQA